MATYELEDWNSVPSNWTKRSVRLTGNRTPMDGHRNPVTTSEVKHIIGREVTTKSGSVYILGTPSKEYLDSLPEHAVYDENRPDIYECWKAIERDT